MSSTKPVALHSIDRYVTRTQNWMYDHLRCLPDYKPVVCAIERMNLAEFPGIPSWKRHYGQEICLRAWRKLVKQELFPTDVLRFKYYQPKVLHSHFGYIGLADFAIQQHLQVPWLVGFYGADAYQGSVEKLSDRYETLFSTVDRVLALGPRMKERLEIIGCPKEKAVVHPLGVDTNDIPCEARTLAKGERLRLIFAGTFREKKGVPYLIEALGLLKKRGVDFELLLIGDEAGKKGDREIKEEIFRLISKFDLEEHITHQTFLPYKDLLSACSSCHIFLAPSITAEDGDSEGTPFVIQQMMASGMPVVSTKHSDIPFIFGDKKEWLLGERDSIGIADRLEEYSTKPDLVKQHGLELRAEIEKIDTSVCAARTAELYHQLST